MSHHHHDDEGEDVSVLAKKLETTNPAELLKGLRVHPERNLTTVVETAVKCDLGGTWGPPIKPETYFPDDDTAFLEGAPTVVLKKKPGQTLEQRVESHDHASRFNVASALAHSVEEEILRDLERLHGEGSNHVLDDPDDWSPAALRGVDTFSNATVFNHLDDTDFGSQREAFDPEATFLVGEQGPIDWTSGEKTRFDRAVNRDRQHRDPENGMPLEHVLSDHDPVRSTRWREALQVVELPSLNDALSEDEVASVLRGFEQSPFSSTQEMSRLCKHELEQALREGDAENLSRFMVSCYEAYWSSAEAQEQERGWCDERVYLPEPLEHLPIGAAAWKRFVQQYGEQVGWDRPFTPQDVITLVHLIYPPKNPEAPVYQRQTSLWRKASHPVTRKVLGELMIEEVLDASLIFTMRKPDQYSLSDLPIMLEGGLKGSNVRKLCEALLKGLVTLDQAGVNWLRDNKEIFFEGDTDSPYRAAILHLLSHLIGGAPEGVYQTLEAVEDGHEKAALFHYYALQGKAEKEKASEEAAVVSVLDEVAA